jgi:hypothetical protein
LESTDGARVYTARIHHIPHDTDAERLRQACRMQVPQRHERRGIVVPSVILADRTLLLELAGRQRRVRVRDFVSIIVYHTLEVGMVYAAPTSAKGTMSIYSTRLPNDAT